MLPQLTTSIFHRLSQHDSSTGYRDLTATQNLPLSSLLMAKRQLPLLICTYPRRDGQAEMTWIALIVQIQLDCINSSVPITYYNQLTHCILPQSTQMKKDHENIEVERQEYICDKTALHHHQTLYPHLEHLACVYHIQHNLLL